jgi:phospholipase C
MRFAASVVLGLATLAACTSKKDDPVVSAPDATVDERPPTPAEWDRDVTRPDNDAAAASRASCTFERGALPAETLGKDTPVGDEIPITNVIVLMQENRSFDSYFGHLNAYAKRTDIASAPDDATNPDKAGGATGAHPYQHAKHLCFFDTDHTWHGSHLEYNGGKNDGFYEANDGRAEGDAGPIPNDVRDGERALWWYDQRDIPFYYDLASTFAIADHYHCSLLGPTWPNRMFLYGASSYGRTSNVFPDLTLFRFPDKDAVIFDELEKRHVDWNVFADGSPGAAVILGTTLVNRYGRNPARSVKDFMAQIADGTLPAVSFVDAKIGISEGPANDDEHPPAQIQVGQKFVSDVVHAVMAGPKWKSTVLFLTYDEHGGIYDHVPPPEACAPDAIAPELTKDDVGVAGDFTRLGFRVPLIVVSPYAKKGHVSHVTYDHTSITRFIEQRFKLPALSKRDANADPLSDMFDWKNPPFLSPPSFAAPSVDQAELDYCVKTFGRK